MSNENRTSRTQEAAPAAGSLNAMQQLQESFAALLSNAGAEETWRKEVFQKVRILVVGKGGAGKTTLIRLIVGKDGPQTISEGVAGVQNINDEFTFSSEEQGVLLAIHDSNGMDVQGEVRKAEIKTFLDEHQIKSGDDFTERIHLVWYVISAMDGRCIDDGGVMHMIAEDYKIPLLLIMTHCDYRKVKVTDTILDQLLQNAYPVDDAARESVRKMMVPVKNDGVCLGANQELIIDESKRDTEGLKLVARRTQLLLDKKLRYTWIAAQAVDIDGKVNASAGIIASYSRTALQMSLARIVPLADPIKIGIIFYRLLVIMCQIWVVPPELQKVLKETLLHKEASSHVLRSLGEDLAFAAGMAITVAATLLTGGILLPPAAIAVLPKLGTVILGKSVPILVKTFALQVLGTILYVKSAQEGRSKCRWKPGVSTEEYTTLCKEFAFNAKYQMLLVEFAKKEHSTLDTALRANSKVKGMIKSRIVGLYRQLLRDRPKSLFSHLQEAAMADANSEDDQEDDVFDGMESIYQGLESTSTLVEDSEYNLDDVAS